MDIFSALFNQAMDKDSLKKLGESVNAKPDQVEKLAEVGFPTLLEALTRNAKTKEGAESLDRALDQHKNDNVNDVLGFLKNADTQDGGKILEHILGGKKSSVQTKLASHSGLDQSQVSGLLSKFAPLVMAYLGNKKKSGLSLNDSSNKSEGLGALLGGLGSSSLLGMASKFLDSDGDGDVMDDIGKVIGGLFK